MATAEICATVAYQGAVLGNRIFKLSDIPSTLKGGAREQWAAKKYHFRCNIKFTNSENIAKNMVKKSKFLWGSFQEAIGTAVITATTQ